jgi:serpin B
VFQRTAVEMDEKGTKAAAVTGIMFDTCSIEIDERPIKNVVLDRPFMFMILDDDNNILFYGNIENPNN